MKILRVVLVACLISVFGAVISVTPATGQDTPDYVGSNPPGGGETVSGTGGTSRGGSASNNGGGVLPTTGADIAVILAVAVGAIGLGLSVTRSARQRNDRRTASAA